MQEFLADLHIHSRFSRATSRKLNLPLLAAWARLKGITVLGTGDFTHPRWREEIGDSLIMDQDSGLYVLKNPAEAVAALPDLPVQGLGLGKALSSPKAQEDASGLAVPPIHFMLQGEISSIYKRGGKVRKVHNLVYMPTLEAAEAFSLRLGQVGNLHSDGRPILGLDSRDLLELVLEAHPQAFLIPAHVWTPWFSLFGSKSGFDAIEECYGDLSREIFALETGLSSDPAMNRLWSALDDFRLVSNSDAHSGENLGREANVFAGKISYAGILEALKQPGRERDTIFLGTLEFFPEEGKYHMDGHRKCNLVLSPAQTREYGGICPVCGGPLTVGVFNRVMELADRDQPVYQPGDGPLSGGLHEEEPSDRDAPDALEERGFASLVPLAEVLGEVLGVGPKSRKVGDMYAAALERFGPELAILRTVPEADLARFFPPLGEAVGRMRRGEVHLKGGYDGEYGVVRMFSEREREDLLRKAGGPRKKGTARSLGLSLLGESAETPVPAAASGPALPVPASSKPAQPRRKRVPSLMEDDADEEFIFSSIEEGTSLCQDGPDSPNPAIGPNADSSFPAVPATPNGMNGPSAGGRSHKPAGSPDVWVDGGPGRAEDAPWSQARSVTASGKLLGGQERGLETAGAAQRQGVPALEPDGATAHNQGGNTNPDFKGDPILAPAGDDSACDQQTGALALTPEQERAARSGPAPVLVLAGPGTGKTRTLIARMLHLLDEGIGSRRILGVTFTRRAAAEMDARLTAALPPGSPLPRTDTLHALALELWHKTHSDVPVLLSEEDARRVFAEANPDESAATIREAWAAVNLSRERLEHCQPEYAEMGLRYVTQKNAWNLADYTDLLEFWLEQIAGGLFSSPWGHVLVDEVQDLSQLQLSLVRSLFPTSGEGFFGIGDPDQSIYGFRGAHGQCLDFFRASWPGLECIRLTRNYRSRPGILKIAHAALGEEAGGDTLVPARLEPAAIHLFSAPSAEAEATWIADRAAELVGLGSHTLADAGADKRGLYRQESDYSPGDIAVLVRTHALAPPYRKALERKGIPVSEPTGDAFWADERVALILRAAGRMLGIAVAEEERDHGVPVCPDKVLANGPLGVAAYLAAFPPFDDRFWQSAAFRSMLKAYNENGGWAGMITWISLQNELELVRSKAEKVQVITMHAAKGTEFRTVFLPALEDGLMPYAGPAMLTGKLSDRGAEFKVDKDQAEERRLLYVALTRAKDSLFLSQAGKRMLYGRELRLKPSRFLKDIPEDLLSRTTLVAKATRKEQHLRLI